MRYAVQRFGTWEWLDYEAPLVTDDGPEWCLNAYGVMDATVPAPAAHRMTGPDGEPLFEEWSTFIHVEVDDPGRMRRLWTGIVAEAELSKQGWELTILEFPGYLQGVPFEGLVRGVNDDPADLMRQLVATIQAYQNAWLGMSVHGSTSVRAGTDLDDRIAAARATMDARRKTLDSFSKTVRDKTKELQDLDATLADEVTQARSLVTQAQAALNTLIAAGASSAQVEAARLNWVAARDTYNAAYAGYQVEVQAGRAALASAKTTKDAAQKAYDQAKDAYDVLRDRRRDGEGAYVIDGQDLPDTYKAFQDLADQYSLEWVTDTSYSEGEPDVRIRVQHPAVGARRDDLVFDTAVNILEPLELERLPYANAAVGVGAGEGDAAIRRSMSVPSARLRRPVVVEDRSAKSNARLDAAMRKVLSESTGDVFPTEIEVRDHPNARIGSWSPGDVISVAGVTTVGTEWSGLARIVAWSWPSRFRARLRLGPV